MTTGVEIGRFGVEYLRFSIQHFFNVSMSDKQNQGQVKAL
jgi:hypothetical protein